jgi:FkbM family methyltransferase
MKDRVRAILPRAIRPRRILGGPLRGCWLVTSWHDYPAGLSGRTERALLDWFAKHVQPGETWLDVGAHYGYTAFALGRLVGPAGRVLAFEPVVASAGCVERGRELNRLNQVTVLPFGLGEVEHLKVVRLPVTRGMADSSLLPSSDTGSATISIARFDWLWPLVDGGGGGGGGQIHGVKIDVQGMEVEALTGMRNALARWHPCIVLELHAGVSRERVLSLLESMGYSRDAVPVDPLPDEGIPRFVDDRSYVFRQA